MLLKVEFRGSALNSHGNYIVGHGKSWKNHGIVFLNLSENPVVSKMLMSFLSVTVYQFWLLIVRDSSLECSQD